VCIKKKRRLDKEFFMTFSASLQCRICAQKSGLDGRLTSSEPNGSGLPHQFASGIRFRGVVRRHQTPVIGHVPYSTHKSFIDHGDFRPDRNPAKNFDHVV
jgi:hypothetical protein